MHGDPARESRGPEQAAVLALRDNGRALEVCLLRKRKSNKWGIPKGLIDPGQTPEETALNEAWEEAGIVGALVGPSLGTYSYEKWGSVLTVAVYVMRVVDEHATWPEMSFRERAWKSMSEAASLLATHPVRPLLDRVASLRPSAT
jgi:8-oxo-dGTP pyrophosphatase MutT (NUDIX family)